MKASYKFLTCLLIAVCTSVVAVQAQSPDPWDDADSADVPLDGGLSLLLAAGIGYGASKYHDRKKQAVHKEDNHQQ